MEQFSELIKHQTLADYDFDRSAQDHFLVYFMEKYVGNNLQCRSLEFDIKSDTETIIDQIFNIVSTIDKEAKIHTCYLSTRTISIQTANIQIFICNRDARYSGRPSIRLESGKTKSKIRCYEFEIYSDPERLGRLLPLVSNLYKSQSHVRITWCFFAGGYVESTPLYIEHKFKLYDEFYPWFENGVDAFINKYLNSEDVILLLRGDPGTGKTSFLKHLLLNNKLNAMISYDEKVLSDDRFFIDFLTSDENNFLIVEDADTLLLSREDDKNHVMSKFLNVSDGLIKIADKKMVFTTNISQVAKIDQALIRKGRCFSMIEFRNLTSKEAEIAAKAAGLTDKDWKSKTSWSIADIFNDDISGLEKQPINKIGF